MKRSVAVLLLCTFAIFCVGLLMVYNTTSAEILDRSLETDTRQALIKQAIYGIVGLCFGVALYYCGYRRFLQNTSLFVVITVILLLCVFIPKIGAEINGAKRWISFMGLTFQPSEMAKFLFPLFLLQSLSKEKKIDFFLFCKRVALFLLPIALILIEPDNGTTAIILASFVVCFFLLRIRWVFWAFPLVCVVFVGMLAAYNMPHVQRRIEVYLHPESDLMGKGHQPHQAKIAAGSGRLWGKGAGESLQKLTYLPEARSDYIAAIFAEEFGFVGIVFLIFLYLLLTASGFAIAFQAADKLGYYAGAIITFLLSFQAFLNLGVVSNLLPSKGTTLPFFSQGGSSLIVNICALALLASIGNYEKKRKKA